MNKRCLNCGSTFNEPLRGPELFFCTNRCANAYSNTPQKAKHTRIMRTLLFKESEHWERLDSEIIEDPYWEILSYCSRMYIKNREVKKNE